MASVVIADRRKDTASRRTLDQRFFAAILVWLWAGVICGFGFDMVKHLQNGGLHYPLIVHLHAVVFVGWMVLFTCQLFFIRAGKPATHKRLGIALAGFVGLMLVVGLVTTYQVDRARMLHPGTGDPVFFVVAASTVIAFALLACAGLCLRKQPDAHKRLMLLAAIYVTDAGFGRLMPLVTVPLVHDVFWRAFLTPYLMPDLAMLALGVHDLVTRKRLFPAYVAGLLFALGVQLLSAWMLVDSPATHAAVLRLLGG